MSLNPSMIISNWLFRNCQNMCSKSQTMQFYKLCRIFYPPRSISTISTDIGSYSALTGLETPTHKLQDEWDVDITAAKVTKKNKELVDDLDLHAYWQSMTHHTRNMGKVAMDLIWTRITSMDYQHSFSQYNNLLTNRREMLTEEHTKQLVMLKFNGDMEGRMTL